MFAFVCPIRHPDSSNNYHEVLKLLELTIASVCAQNTLEEFVFVIVCNEIPKINISAENTSKVIFLPVDFAPPDNNKGTSVSLEAVKFDKGIKITRGLLHLKSYMPDYVYVIDGDDWININVLKIVDTYTKSKHENVDLWYANSGYIVNFKNQTYIKKYGVCRYCGSTFIYKYKTIMNISGLSDITDESLSSTQITTQIDEHILKNILGNHRHQIPFFKAKKLKIKEIPIPAVCWILNSGENHTGKNGGSSGLKFTSKFLSNFGVSNITITPQRITIKSILLAKYDSLVSYLGWRSTNKKLDKI